MKPLFSCWYQHATTEGDSALTLNLVFGYNNTHRNDKMIDIDPVTNVVSGGTTLLLDQQPTVFSAGYHPFAFVAHDVTPHLSNHQNKVQWDLAGKIASVSRKDINKANRCATLFKKTCTPDIDHFCDDGTFCNGEEQCVLSRGSSVGACRPSSNGPVCKGPGVTCDNKKRACVSTTTKALKPLVSQEAVPFVNAKTVGDVACTTDTECTGIATYCDGTYTCDTGLGICMPANTSYTPCENSLVSLTSFYMSNNSGHQLLGSPISIHCVEEIKLCVQLFSCIVDSDCADNLTCNGVERCLAGTCVFQSDQSPSAVCHTTQPVQCTELLGCVINGVVPPTASPTAPPTSSPVHSGHSMLFILGCVVVVVVLLGGIVLLVVIFYDYNASNVSSDGTFYTFNNGQSGTSSSDTPLYNKGYNNNAQASKYGLPFRAFEKPHNS